MIDKLKMAMLAEAILDTFGVEHGINENDPNYRKAEALVLTIATEAVKDFKKTESYTCRRVVEQYGRVRNALTDAADAANTDMERIALDFAMDAVNQAFAVPVSDVDPEG